MHQLIQFKKIKEDELQKFSPGIHAELKKFYPLGLKKEQADYNKSPGIKKINSIIQDNILNAENFRSRWTEGFHHNLAKALHLEVKGATGGLVPCTGGIISMGEDHLGYPIELHYYVSLLNNYFSIQLVETGSMMNFPKKYVPNSFGTGTKKITVSPVPGPYQSLFLELENYLAANLTDAVFIPFIFDTLQLKGFQVSYKECVEDECFISDAFFHKLFSTHFKTEIIGDIKYKLQDIK